MANEQHRHDITDAAWAVIEPHTIGNKGSWGGNARDTRQFINAVFWILRTGRHGEICRPNTATGRIRIDVSAVGATSESGSESLKHS